jgi:hypothetical protein
LHPPKIFALRGDITKEALLGGVDLWILAAVNTISERAATDFALATKLWRSVAPTWCSG